MTVAILNWWRVTVFSIDRDGNLAAGFAIEWSSFTDHFNLLAFTHFVDRTILGEQGAEQLLGQGDMLFIAGGGRISRLHGPFVSDDDTQLMKFHGLYQQDDRDVRSERRKQKLEKAFSFMIRVAVPGGVAAEAAAATWLGGAEGSRPLLQFTRRERLGPPGFGLAIGATRRSAPIVHL